MEKLTFEQELQTGVPNYKVHVIYRERQNITAYFHHERGWLTMVARERKEEHCMPEGRSIALYTRIDGNWVQTTVWGCEGPWCMVWKSERVV